MAFNMTNRLMLDEDSKLREKKDLTKRMELLDRQREEIWNAKDEDIESKNK